MTTGSEPNYGTNLKILKNEDIHFISQKQHEWCHLVRGKADRWDLVVLNFIGEKLEIFIFYLTTSAVVVVNVCKLNKTNDVGALRLIVCSKYQEDKRQVLTLNHQVAGIKGTWTTMLYFQEMGKLSYFQLDFHGLNKWFGWSQMSFVLWECK